MSTTTPTRLLWHRGQQGYVAAMILLSQRDWMIGRLAKKMRTQEVSIRRFLRAMRQFGMAHVCAWKPPVKKGYHRSVWRFGPGVDAPAPTAAPRLSDEPVLGVEVVAFAEFMRALMAGGAAVHDLGEASGMTKQTCARMLKILHDAGAVHISGWDRTRHIPAPAYTWGPGVDARRPPPQAKKIIWRRHDAKRRARLQQERILNALAASNAPTFNPALCA